MMVLRLPFVSRLMVLDIRLERWCSREYYPPLVSADDLNDLHQRELHRKEMALTQLRWDREKVYSGSMMLR